MDDPGHEDQTPRAFPCPATRPLWNGERPPPYRHQTPLLAPDATNSAASSQLLL